MNPSTTVPVIRDSSNLLGALGPSIAAIVSTLVFEGTRELSMLFERLLNCLSERLSRSLAVLRLQGGHARLSATRGFLQAIRDRADAGGLRTLNNSDRATMLRSLLFVLKRHTTLREIGFAVGKPAVQGLLLAFASATVLMGLVENGRLRFALVILVGILAGALVAVIFAVRTEQSIYSHVRRLGARLRVVTYHLIGRTESGLYRWRNAVRWYRRVLDISDVPRASDLLGIVLCDLGGAWIFGGRKQQSLAEFEKGLRLYEQETTVSDLGRARILIGRMNAFVHFGDCSASFTHSAGKAEKDFLDGMRICSPHDPTLRWGDEAYGREVDVSRLTVMDPYGASKAHCQYAWGLLERETERALWHAEIALAYAQLIEDSIFSPRWGLRDGAVGSYWREAVALFTVADCYTLMEDLEKAGECYRRSHQRIPYRGRRWYFMGHYWWLHLCRRGRVEEAREWLGEVIRVSYRDGYWWRAALARMHCGDLERCFSDTGCRESIQQHYGAALGIARAFGFRSLAVSSEGRIAHLEPAVERTVCSADSGGATSRQAAWRAGAVLNDMTRERAT